MEEQTSTLKEDRSPQKAIYIYADFGNLIGLGHLSRSSHIADHLDKLNIRVELITSSDLKQACQRTKILLSRFNAVNRLACPVPIEQNDQSLFLNCIISQITKKKIKAIIVDHYHITLNTSNILRKHCKIIAIYDEWDETITKKCRDNYRAIVYANVEHIASPYALFGIDNMPLFPTVIKLKQPSEYKTVPTHKKIMFMAPGAAGHNFILSFLNYTEKKSFKSRYQLVTYDARLGSRPDVMLISGAQGLFSYLAYADIVITAAGNTLIECMKLNVETISFITHTNQKQTMDFYRDQGMLTEALEPQEVARIICDRKMIKTKNKACGEKEIVTSYDRLIEFITSGG